MRNLLLYLSKQSWMKSAITGFPLSRNVASRFVAGDSIDDVIRVTRELTSRGKAVTADHLGEHVTDIAEVKAAHTQYLELIDRLSKEKLDANVSVKLSEMGQDIDEGLCRSNMDALLQHAAQRSMFVRIDMESSAYTERTMNMFLELRKTYENVGIVLQSYLHRTADDVKRTLELNGRIRLCKGAYSEPATVAFQDKAEVDRNFAELAGKLVTSGVFHGIATHDDAMIAATIAAVKKAGLKPDAFEFQMLFGVRRDLQDRLLKDGWKLRIYVPYGDNWYPYMMRRMAERPANLLFVMRSLFQG